MTQPNDHVVSAPASISDEIHRDIIRWLCRAGWLLLGSVALSWVSAVSYSAVRVWIVEDRQRIQYEHIRDALVEIRDRIDRQP